MPDIPPVGEADLQSLRELLREAGLPADAGDHTETLVAVARDGDAVVAGVAVEIHEGLGLLRSLVVGSSHRSGGLGTGLVAAAHATAADHGISALYLLTETAEGFFERFGYSRIDRSEVPGPLQASSEFSELCPDTAVAMVKAL